MSNEMATKKEAQQKAKMISAIYAQIKFVLKSFFILTSLLVILGAGYWLLGNVPMNAFVALMVSFLIVAEVTVLVLVLVCVAGFIGLLWARLIFSRFGIVAVLPFWLMTILLWPILKRIQRLQCS